MDLYFYLLSKIVWYCLDAPRRKFHHEADGEAQSARSRGFL